MMKTWISAAAAALTIAAAGPGAAAPVREYVTVGRVAGVVTHPEGTPSRVAIVYHNGAGGPGSPVCTEMASRGFLTWCALPAALPPGGQWENYALDVKAAITYLRQQPGVDAVVLYGHSGGGATASFYQAVAENGVAFCQDPKKLSACSDALAGLPKADAVVFPDAHPGLGVMDLRMINPSLTVKGTKVAADPSLDPFSPTNGFNAKGPSHYSAEFQARYFAAQAAAMNARIAEAQAIKAGLASGEIAGPLMRQVFTPGVGFANHLDELDPDVAVTTATRSPRRLLLNDGKIVVRPIKSVMVGHPESVGMAGDTAATAPLFLSRGAVRATDSMSGVDWCSANSVTVCNIRSIHVPTLIIPAGANNFIGDGERMFEGSPAADKEYIVVEGALHGGQPCTACEKTPGQYGNSSKNQFDYIAGWINKRFPAH